jgi:hypothetical protein
METKSCRKCGETRPVTEFYVQDKATGRLNPWCKVCYREWYRGRGGYRGVEQRACEVCGKEYTASTSKRRFCGQNCKQRARTARVHPVPTKVCPVCKVEFASAKRTYCTQACATAARRADGREALASRKHNLKKFYGLTQADFDRMLEVQDGRCAICHGDDPRSRTKQWHIDHNHETGIVRGLLCGPCNTGIGQMQDDPVRLRAAADYLERGAGHG